MSSCSKDQDGGFVVRNGRTTLEFTLSRPNSPDVLLLPWSTEFLRNSSRARSQKATIVVLIVPGRRAIFGLSSQSTFYPTSKLPRVDRRSTSLKASWSGLRSRYFISSHPLTSGPLQHRLCPYSCSNTEKLGRPFFPFLIGIFLYLFFQFGKGKASLDIT